MMKLIKLLPVLLLLFAIIPASLHADEAEPDGFANYFSNLSTSLDLTDKQKTEVRPIFLNSYNETEGIFQKYGFYPAKGERPSIFKIGDMKREVEQSEARTDEKLRAILSDEQMEDLKQFRDEEEKKLEQEYEANKK